MWTTKGTKFVGWVDAEMRSKTDATERSLDLGGALSPGSPCVALQHG